MFSSSVVRSVVLASIERARLSKALGPSKKA
jgi:hypothetical protein